MSVRGNSIIRSAIDLPERERIRIVEQLLASLDEEDCSREAVDRAWAKEIECRSREIDDGSAKLFPWATVRARIRRQLRGRK